MTLFYTLFIQLFRLGIGVAALWNGKAKAWIEGRKNLFTALEEEFSSNQSSIWMHCASAGEFEQGKPVLERLKEVHPNYRFVVSFFSPSGYAAGKKYGKADHIVYLPLDTAANARRFINIINPSLVIFVKYDWWFHHLATVKEKDIPLLMVSAIFRKQSIFFKWYGGLHRKMLLFFTQIFVQNIESQELLAQINITHSSVGGDTRFDRVAAIAADATGIEPIEKFIQSQQVLVAGSTWPEDEALIKSLAQQDSIKIIIAPHEINKAHLDSLHHLFPQAILYSQLDEKTEGSILIIDNVGMLSRLYQYATICYIGGGFNKSGIHNTLEAAVWGKPVIFGPNYQKFQEAKGLIKEGAAFSVHSSTELIQITEKLLTDEEYLTQSGKTAAAYVSDHKGATEKIIRYIQENRLLTTA